METTLENGAEQVASVYGSQILDNATFYQDSSLFDDITENDLKGKEKTFFLKGEIVRGEILDILENSKFGYIQIDIKLETTDLAGEVFELRQYKPKVIDGKMNPMQKQKWVSFILSLFTQEEVLNRKFDLTKHIGKKYQFKAKEVREWNGKKFQDYEDMKVIDELPF